MAVSQLKLNLNLNPNPSGEAGAHRAVLASSAIGFKIMTVKVTAVVHKADEGGFWAEVPSLPGCRTQGETMDELKANLREAVELYLETDPSGLTADKNSQLLELAV